MEDGLEFGVAWVAHGVKVPDRLVDKVNLDACPVGAANIDGDVEALELENVSIMDAIAVTADCTVRVSAMVVVVAILGEGCVE